MDTKQMEEFIIRIGANARAMYSELQRAGSYAKAWGLSVAESLKSSVGRVFTGAFVLMVGQRILDGIKNKILAINRAQNELPGASTNFIQGLFNWTEKMGLSYENLSKPLLAFKRNLDSAIADPQGKQMQNLIRYGIATSAADLHSQKLSTTVGRLSDAYLKYGKNLQMVSDVAGRAAKSEAFLQILELGGKNIGAMEGGNFFTKLTPSAISQFSGLYAGAKTTGQVTAALIGNLAGLTMQIGAFIPRMAAQDAGHISAGDTSVSVWQSIKDAWNGIDASQAKSNAALAASIEMEKEKVSILTQQAKLLEQQRELQNTLTDRGKVGMDQMASEAAKLTGYKSPLTYRLTPLMRDSLRIKKLEDKATLAWENKEVRSPHESAYWQEAQSLRAGNTYLKAGDQNPDEITHKKLDIIAEELVPCAKAARFVNENSSPGGGGSGGS